MNLFRLTLCAVLIVVLAGCSTRPTEEEIATADYGASISHEDAKIMAAIFLQFSLKDPDSAKYQWGQLRRSWIRESLGFDSTFKFGYFLDVDVNAKNSFGGYTGYKPFRFMFFDREIVRVDAQDLLGNMKKVY